MNHQRRRRFSESEIGEILERSRAGTKANELCELFGMHRNTLSKWRQKFRGISGGDVDKLRVLEEENRKLKHLLAQRERDIEGLNVLARRGLQTLAQRRQGVEALISEANVSERRACRLTGCTRRSFRYVPNQKLLTTTA